MKCSLGMRAQVDAVNVKQGELDALREQAEQQARQLRQAEANLARVQPSPRPGPASRRASSAPSSRSTAYPTMPGHIWHEYKTIRDRRLAPVIRGQGAFLASWSSPPCHACTQSWGTPNDSQQCHMSHGSTSFSYSRWRQVRADVDALPAAHSAASQGAAEADIGRQRDDVHQLDVQVRRDPTLPWPSRL